jgi:hypothetical protein
MLTLEAPDEETRVSGDILLFRRPQPIGIAVNSYGLPPPVRDPKRDLSCMAVC